MKAIFLILILFNILWAVTWPTGTKAVIPLTVNHTKIGEDATNFCYQKVLLLANDQQFKNAFRSAANITIFDTVTGLVRPSRITYNTKDSVYIYFDAPASTSADKVFYVCAGLTINRTNSSTAFTNSNITNYWSMGDSVSPVIDAADAKNGTVTGATLGAAGQFGRCVNFTEATNTISFPALNTLRNVTKFTVSMFLYPNGTTLGTHYLFFRYTDANSMTWFYLNTSTGVINARLSDGTNVGTASYTIPTFQLNQWYNFIFVYDGSLSNANRLKIYTNKIASTSYSGTFPTATPDVTTNYTIGNAGNIDKLGLVDEVSVSSDAYTAGRVTSRYEMVMNPSTFWTQGGSIPVNKSNNNESRWGAFKRAYRGAFQPAYKPTYK